MELTGKRAAETREIRMKTIKLTAGAIVEARCTCSLEALNHTIVAMTGEQVVQVECNMCHETHSYQGEKVAEEPPTASAAPKKVTAPRANKKDPEAADRAEWAALQPTVELARAIPYDMNGKYRAKKLLMHPVFGLGIVQVVLPPNKIKVLFQDGKKLLRCG
jgi:hypothetical protein